MFERIAILMVFAVHTYMYVGAAFALAFVVFGVSRLDHEASDSGPIFRAVIFPGAVALWPVLLVRWIQGKHEAPVQKDPHR
jgi:hypothetical protein